MTDKNISRVEAMNEKKFEVGREKHLDHLVRVVPFIVLLYAFHCYFIMQLVPVDFVINGQFFLGGCLGFMIGCFISYDLTHVVTLGENSLDIKVAWLNYHRSVCYSDVAAILISEPGQTFATVTVITQSGTKYSFYFVDDADKIKSWIEQRRISEFKSAA